MTHSRYILLLLLGLSFASTVHAITAEEVEMLDESLAQREHYDSIKRERIKFLKSQPVMDYDVCYALFNEYKSYSYDTADVYAEQLVDISTALNDDTLFIQAQLARAFIALSSGLFKESADIYASLDPRRMPDRLRIEYYFNYSRLLYDMADYVHGQRSVAYTNQGCALANAALKLLSPDKAQYWLCSAGLSMRQNDFNQALSRFMIALQDSAISEHDCAIAYSSMGYIYYVQGDTAQAEHYEVLAAISDIRSSTKETTALTQVAQMLYKDGQVDLAARYLRIAMEDAVFYNARHRQISISKILPIIEHEKLAQVEAKNRSVHRLTIMLYALLVILMVILVILASRIQRIHKDGQLISTINDRLQEANRIKEEYLGSCFFHQSALLEKLEKYERFVKRKAQEKRTDELMTIPVYIDAEMQRRAFYQYFDEVFLRIFPNFVSDFNALLRPNEQIVLKKGELLNTELRIFALIRLGINNNEHIARVLNYSVNTIYTYKTRIHNRSDLDYDQFYQRLALISTH